MQLAVVRVIVPGEDGHGVLWLEHVGYWRVVHDDNVGHLSAETGHVLHVGILKPGTMLAEQLVRANLVGVDNID
jgi:hypothetical protein